MAKNKNKEMQSNLNEMQSSELPPQMKPLAPDSWYEALSDVENGATPAAGVPVAPQAPAPAPQPPKEQTWLIHHAAKHMIAGYKETWWASIRSMADTMRLGESATESQCRSLFLRWGAKLK